MNGVNPYAAPRPQSDDDDVPDAPQSAGWALSREMLLVRQEAQLPMVDPFTGISSNRMILRNISISHSPAWHRWTMAAGIGALVAGGFFHLPQALSIFLLGSGGFGSLAYLVAAIFFKAVRIRIFTSEPSNRKIWLGGLLNSATSFTLILLIVLAGYGKAHPAILTGISILFGFLIIGLLSYRILSRDLKCRRKIGDRFEIRGLHPQAIKYLREMEEQRPFRYPNG